MNKVIWSLKRVGFLIVTIFFITFLGIFLNKEKLLENIRTTTNGGEFATGVKIDITDSEGGIIGESTHSQESHEENYTKYKERNYFVSFSPAKQAKIGRGYATNTQLMNDYLSKNTFQFLIPEGTKTGYLYIRLKKSTQSGVFIYRYKSNKNGYTVSGNLDKTKSLIDSDTELLYKLDDIPYIRFYDKKSDTYNWLSQMNLGTNNNFIAGFVRDYDGSNKIDELTIAWE